MKQCKKISNMEKFLKTGERYEKICRKLRKECEEFLKDFLLGQPERRYEIHTYNDEGTQMDDIYLSVGYSGNHPEYDSTLYAEVDAIYWSDNGGVKLDLSEEGEYDIDYITTSELYTICKTIVNEIED